MFKLAMTLISTTIEHKKVMTLVIHSSKKDSSQKDT